jgi:solute carrier family 25 protein 38
MLNKSKRSHYELLSFREAVMLIKEREGFRGYYRGFFPSLLKNSLNSGTYFSTLYSIKRALHTATSLSDNSVNFWASAMARTLQSTLCNPLVVVKTRFEVLGFQEYTGLLDAINKVYKNEGAGGFFTGLKISLIRDVPFSGIFFPIYMMSKEFFSLVFGVNLKDKSEINYRGFTIAAVSSLSSLSANFLSCLITHPLDIIRTRVFFQYYNKDTTQHYSTLYDAIRKIYEHDGMLGYFRGLSPRLMRKGLGNILAWGLFEYLVDKRSGIKIE